MAFVTSKQIDPTVRDAQLARYREQLRQRLLDPSLLAAQRSAVKAQLNTLGSPKVYRQDSPPREGAIDNNPV